jgi:ribosomal protein S18 acetylase RimI-like enzyme
MLVRDADLADVDGLASCIVASWLEAHQHQVPRELWERRRENWTVEVSAAAWNRTLQEVATEAAVRSHVLVATESESESEMIVGLVMGTVNESGEGEVDALYVAPGHQGRGVGRRLLSASFERLRAAGAENARVVVLAANAPRPAVLRTHGGQRGWVGRAGRGPRTPSGDRLLVAPAPRTGALRRCGAVNIGCSAWAALQRDRIGVDRITERLLCVGRRRASCRISGGFQLGSGQAIQGGVPGVYPRPVDDGSVRTKRAPFVHVASYSIVPPC